MNDNIYDPKRNAVKIGTLNDENFDETVSAWYFHKRGSLLIGRMNENSFIPKTTVQGTNLTDVTKNLAEEFNCQLTSAGEGIHRASQMDNSMSLKQSLVFNLCIMGFKSEEVAKILNLEKHKIEHIYKMDKNNFME